MPVNHTINIVKTRKNSYRVRPGKLSVDEGDTITWTNQILDKTSVTVKFSGNDDPFVGNSFSNDGEVFTPSQSKAFTVKNNIPPYAEFVYSVTANDGTQIDGDSPPEIDVP